MSRGTLVDVECRLVGGAETDKAWAVTTDATYVDRDGRERLRWHWLPKSQVEVSEPDRDGRVTATMPRWLAEEKELV